MNHEKLNYYRAMATLKKEQDSKGNWRAIALGLIALSIFIFADVTTEYVAALMGG